MKNVATLMMTLCLSSLIQAQVVDPSVTTAMVCAPGYTKTVRPPISVTQEIKFRKLAEANLPLRDSHLYELDHIVPLELGGAASDERNLQLQLWPIARAKDKMENAHHRAVCAGKETLQEAQEFFITKGASL